MIRHIGVSGSEVEGVLKTIVYLLARRSNSNCGFYLTTWIVAVPSIGVFYMYGITSTVSMIPIAFAWLFFLSRHAYEVYGYEHYAEEGDSYRAHVTGVYESWL